MECGSVQNTNFLGFKSNLLQHTRRTPLKLLGSRIYQTNLSGTWVNSSQSSFWISSKRPWCISGTQAPGWFVWGEARTQGNWESQKERVTLGEKIQSVLRRALFLFSFNQFSSTPVQKAHAGNCNFKTDKACTRAGTFLCTCSHIWDRMTTSPVRLWAQSVGVRVWGFSPTVAIKQDQQTMKQLFLPFCLLFQHYLDSTTFHQRHWRPFFKTC